MESILLVVHVIIALVIVGLIMLQQGKGAEMGASFGGGGSQTVFGAAGSGNFFSRMTGILVAVFFATSFVLAMLAQGSIGVDESLIPYLETTTDQPAASINESADPVPGTPPAGDVIPQVESGSTVPEGEVPASE